MKLRFDKDKEKLIITEADRLEYNQLEIWLKRFVKGYRFNPKYKMGIWDGKVDHFHNGSIDMGLWKECLKGLNIIGAPFILENKKDFPVDREITLEKVQDFCKEFFKDHYVTDKKTNLEVPFMPYDYQIETAYKILKNKFCLAEVATSGGKSLILSIVIFYIIRKIDPDYKFLIILPSISLIVQLHDNLIEYNRGFKNDNKNPIDLRVEEIMSDKPRKYLGDKMPNVYLSTYQSLSNTSNWKNSFYQQFDLVSVDESHMAKANSLQKILKKTFTHAKYRFGLSGTFPEEDTCEILTIQSVTGPIVNSISAKSLQEKNKISNVKVKCLTLNHDDYDFDEKLKLIRKNPNNGQKAFQLEKMYIHDSVKRNIFIAKLIGKFDKNSLILFNIIEHGEKIREAVIEQLGDSVEILYVDGTVKKKDREVIFQEMEKTGDKPKILLATFGTLSTGVSINNIHYIVFCDSFKSESRIIQSIGRGLRLHSEKDCAIIFDIIDCFREVGQNNAFYRHGQERRRLYIKHQYKFDNKNFIL